MVLGGDINDAVHDDMYGDMYFLEWFYEDLNDDVYDGIRYICIQYALPRMNILLFFPGHSPKRDIERLANGPCAHQTYHPSGLLRRKLGGPVLSPKRTRSE